mgnify:CR=1 FL=1|jgi:DNA polymerase elongation subunit (family B)|tara:strand:+ start:11829 stop:12842 length:1014 start_codon:yes stop_codon:yes gene_type:complete
MRIKQCLPYDPRLLEFCENENQLQTYKTYGESGSIVNETARRLDKDSSAVSKIVRGIQDRGRAQFGSLDWDDEVGEIVQRPLKILFFDIESMFSTVATFRFYNQNFGHDNVLEYGYMISFAAKWLGTEEVIYEECRDKRGRNKTLVKKMLALFSLADVIIGHNGRSFDIKFVKGEALRHGLDPPIPFKIVDTLAIVKEEFKLPRNSLEYVAEHVGVTPKSKHNKFPGIMLWKECKKGNPEAWEEMKLYNILDTEILESVYYKLRAWSTKHPNLGIFSLENIPMCPKCQSIDLKKINSIPTNTQEYDGYRCNNCGGIARGPRTISPLEKRKATLRNAT